MSLEESSLETLRTTQHGAGPETAVEMRTRRCRRLLDLLDLVGLRSDGDGGSEGCRGLCSPPHAPPMIPLR